MRVPVSWLRELVKLGPQVTDAQIQEAFVSLGFEVESVIIHGSVTGELLTGEVVEIKHLDQFKKPIRYCKVKIGSQTRGIVCGATNFSEGDKVVVAMPGAVLPGNFEIAVRKTYDHLSEGMICSERELGISDSHEGILVLNKSVNSGSDAKKILGLGETVFELSVLPDRGYALSMRGIAREVAAYFNKKYQDPITKYKRMKPTRSGVNGKILANKKVANFSLVTLSGVNPNASTPEFIKHRLNQMGMRSISLPVDVTNYVMFELGQPLHAFDKKSVKGTISVRLAKKGEKIKTLDNQVRALMDTDLVISDSQKAISIAGIMGGANSEISERTREIVIEAATFDAATISHTARRLGLTSEASKRFERSTDPNLPEYAARRAAQLLVEFGGGKIVGAKYKKSPLPAKRIRLKFEQVYSVTGIAIKRSEVIKNLNKIGIKTLEGEKSLTAVIPSWRSDLETPNDLIEEILRLHGYQHIKGRLPKAPSGFGLPKELKIKRQMSQVMAASGSHEVLTYPFMAEADLNKLQLSSKDDRFKFIKIFNPLSDEKPALRTTLLPGLIEVAIRNLSRGINNFSIFEIGNVFQNHKNFKSIPKIGTGFPPKKLTLKEIDSSLALENLHLSLIAVGQSIESGWWGEGHDHSASSVGQILKSLFDQLAIEISFQGTGANPWHPGRSTKLLAAGEVIGEFGQLHPTVVNNFGLSKDVFGFEISLAKIIDLSARDRKYSAIGKMPFAIEDLALVVNQEQNALEIQDAIKRAGGNLMESVNLFDTFTGQQIGEGKKSLTFRLLLRADDRTLTSDDLGQVRERILRRVREDFGARVRT